jgi:hypothetical protein
MISAMKKNHYQWAIPLTGMVLFGTAVSAEQDKYTYMNSTNRVTLSLRFGLNIHSKFSGIGNSFASGSIYGNARRTPNGDPYNYGDGYVLTDSTGNFLGLTTYWGYDSTAAQYNSAADTIALHQTTATGIPSDASSGGDKPFPGFELAYDRELLEKENWHDMRFGLEAALNYMKISLNSSSTFGATVATMTDIYQLPGTTPPAATPGAPFQGTFDGSPGGYSLLGSRISSVLGSPTSATFLTQDHFNADLWGGRLGPYVELPLTKNLDLRLSGGLAIGLLNGNESWTQTLTPLGGSPVTASGGGDAFQTLWGYYASLDADWQINKRWAVDGAVQFQDLGKFTHNFGGRQVELDLSRSLFVELGISYSF